MMPLRLIALAALVFLGFATAAITADAAPSTRGAVYWNLPIPEKVSPADVERVIRFVADIRRWGIDAQEPGLIRISLRHKGITCKVWFSYDARTLTLSHDSVDSAGRPTVPSHWLNNLRADIERQFAAKR